MDLYTRSVLQDELKKRGLRLAAEGETPDLWVSFDGVLVPEVKDPGVHKHVGPLTWVGVTGPDADAFSDPGYRADFVIRFEDAATGTQVWNGRAKGIAISGQLVPEKVQKKIHKAARAVLKRYPPR